MAQISNLKAITLEGLQPMDQEIIEINWKLYRKAFCNACISHIAHDCDKSYSGYSTNLLDTTYLLSQSRKELATTKIVNCFTHVGFFRTRMFVQLVDVFQGYNDLYRNVHEAVCKVPEDDFDLFVLVGTDLALGCSQDKGEEALDREAWKITDSNGDAKHPSFTSKTREVLQERL